MNKEALDIKQYCERVLRGNCAKEESYISREQFEKDLPDKQMQEEFFKYLSEKLDEEQNLRAAYGVICNLLPQELVPKLQELFYKKIIPATKYNYYDTFIVTSLTLLKDKSLESELLPIARNYSHPYRGYCLDYLITINWEKAFYLGMVDLINSIKKDNFKSRNWMGGKESLVECFVREGKQVFIDKALEYFKETGDEKLQDCLKQILANVKKDLARENFQYN